MDPGAHQLMCHNRNIRLTTSLIKQIVLHTVGSDYNRHVYVKDVWKMPLWETEDLFSNVVLQLYSTDLQLMDSFGGSYKAATINRSTEIEKAENCST